MLHEKTWANLFCGEHWTFTDMFPAISGEFPASGSCPGLWNVMECHYCAVALVHVSCLVRLTDSLQLDLRPTLNGIPDPLGGRSSEDPAPSASMRILESGLDPARLLVRVLHLLDGLDWCLKHQTISTVVDMRIQDPLYEANPFKSLRAVAESLLLWEVQSASYARLSKFQRTLPKALGLTHCHLLLHIKHAEPVTWTITWGLCEACKFEQPLLHTSRGLKLVRLQTPREM